MIRTTDRVSELTYTYALPLQPVASHLQHSAVWG